MELPNQIEKMNLDLFGDEKVHLEEGMIRSEFEQELSGIQAKDLHLFFLLFSYTHQEFPLNHATVLDDIEASLEFTHCIVVGEIDLIDHRRALLSQPTGEESTQFLLQKKGVNFVLEVDHLLLLLANGLEDYFVFEHVYEMTSLSRPNEVISEIGVDSLELSQQEVLPRFLVSHVHIDWLDSGFLESPELLLFVTSLFFLPTQQLAIPKSDVLIEFQCETLFWLALNCLFGLLSLHP